MKRDLDMLRTIMLKIETSNKAVHLTDLTDNRADRPTILFHVNTERQTLLLQTLGATTFKPMCNKLLNTGLKQG